ncbi:DDE-domain-containing protein [Zopfia rhizophila CBS 207.26]|uniref:DDE-domain-containing protein n=1 Tax=Zopfia rhizophila CBS 207.26 TaxID=1314779 RepID=A0A6A6DJ13_9PEZI|nr:DDE-domain-containing protein [Zopfia rhizophila CBS 207.26]
MYSISEWPTQASGPPHKQNATYQLSSAMLSLAILVIEKSQLQSRRTGTTLQRNYEPNSKKLTKLEESFDRVQRMIEKYSIAKEDIYNFDETSFQIGVISGGKIVTGSDRRNRRKAVQPGNREWVMAILLFIIFAGTYHLSAWYEGNDIPPDWVISLSDNGWINNELGIKWLQHFNKHIKGRTFYKKKSIITLCMPSHSSHLLQPLNIQQHQNSSPTHIFKSIHRLTKGAELMMHEAVLLRSKAEGSEIIAQANVNAQIRVKTCQSNERVMANAPKQRRCKRCCKPRHNSRTYKKAKK